MKSMLSVLRFVLTVCLCAVLMFTAVMPFKTVMAAPMKNEASQAAKEYEATAKDAIDRGGPQSMEEIEERAKGGAPNEVQGTTGIDEMKRPSNTKGQSVEEKIEKGLDKVQGKTRGAMRSAKDSIR